MDYFQPMCHTFFGSGINRENTLIHRDLFNSSFTHLLDHIQIRNIKQCVWTFSNSFLVHFHAFLISVLTIIATFLKMFSIFIDTLELQPLPPPFPHQNYHWYTKMSKGNHFYLLLCADFSNFLWWRWLRHRFKVTSWGPILHAILTFYADSYLR